MTRRGRLLKKSPNWGRRSILQMNWLFDEYFVKPEVWNAIFQPLGINCRRVLLHGTGQELESVLQLHIPKLVPLQMDSNAFEYERCMFCDRKKYKHVTGFFPGPQTTDFPFFKSVQYFGTGSVPQGRSYPS